MHRVPVIWIVSVTIVCFRSRHHPLPCYFVVTTFSHPPQSWFSSWCSERDQDNEKWGATHTSNTESWRSPTCWSGGNRHRKYGSQVIPMFSDSKFWRLYCIFTNTSFIRTVFPFFSSVQEYVQVWHLSKRWWFSMMTEGDKDNTLINIGSFYWSSIWPSVSMLPKIEYT